MAGWLDRQVDRLPGRVRPGVRLVVATVRDAGEDRVPGLAAEVAFWVLLSLPPLLLAAVSAAGFVGEAIGSDVRAQFIGRVEELAAGVFAADTVEATITPTLEALLTDGNRPLLSVSFLITVWSASRVLRVLVLAITIAYDLEESQPSWMGRILGFVLTVVGLLLGLVLIPALVAGPRLGSIIEDRLGMDLLLGELWRVLYWPLAAVVVTLLLAGLYHWATPWRTPFHRELPGAVLAMVLGLLASTGLRTYIQLSFGGDELYAPLAAPLALLVWIWLMAMGLLMGAELNAEIERAWPAGEPPPDTPTLERLGRRAVDRVKDLTVTSRGDAGGV